MDLAPTCLRLEEPDNIASPLAAGQSADILEDAVKKEKQEEEEIVDAAWVESAITVDVRLSNPTSSYGRSDPHLLNFPGSATESPTAYFLHFLLVDCIQNVVIPAINEHPRKELLSWVNVDYVEYLTWIMIWLIMMICKFTDRKAYWRKSGCPYVLNIDFTEFMEMDCFDSIGQMHVFVIPHDKR
ncbi:hypothetical protein DFQ28_003423 [Apophysomyces sp. BC1034]|nr:hypothetical protein DFQ28_003423 [Apophysomyces sp. BC1034]